MKNKLGNLIDLQFYAVFFLAGSLLPFLKISFSAVVLRWQIILPKWSYRIKKFWHTRVTTEWPNILGNLNNIKLWQTSMVFKLFLPPLANLDTCRHTKSNSHWLYKGHLVIWSLTGIIAIYVICRVCSRLTEDLLGSGIRYLSHTNSKCRYSITYKQ